MKNTAHQKIKEVNSENYGKYYVRELAAITTINKDVDLYFNWANKFHPKSFFGSYGANNWLTNEYVPQEDLHKLSLEDFKKFLTVSYFTVLDIDNLNWKVENEKFIKELEPLEDRMFLQKAKSLPCELGFEEYVTWFINSKPFFAQEWMNANIEYIAEMNEIEKSWNIEFLEAVKDNNFSGVKKGFKRILDMSGDSKQALKIAIENENLQIVKYLISKDMELTQEHLDLNTSSDFKDFLETEWNEMLRKSEKASKRKNKMR